MTNRMTFCTAAILLLSSCLAGQSQEPKWPAPTITSENFSTWMEFVQPSEKERSWTKIRWHKELADAAVEARNLQRPILLFTMNGHPCGET
jgi:hypothetical protein